MSKLQELAESYGYNDPMEMLEKYEYDSVQPGICTNSDCNYTTDVEPDQERGFCEDCGTKTVKSISILMGII